MPWGHRNSCAFFAIPSSTSHTVWKSSSDDFPNLFMLKWVRDSEYFSVESDTSRQPELSLTTNLCSKSGAGSVSREWTLAEIHTVLSCFPTIAPTLLDFNS